MALIKTNAEIKILREGGKRLAEILAKVAEAAKPGASTLDLDRLGEDLILASGGIPSFKGYRIKEARVPYPCSLCISVNDQVVHAIPRRDMILREGDAVGIDIGMKWPGRSGLYTDAAVTIGVGKISSQTERLLRSTKEALGAGIKAVRPGAKIGDVSNAIEKVLERERLGIIRDLAGHGVGHEIHELPLIPNFGRPGSGMEIKAGMVLAIEPMATLGGTELELDEDQWTFRTEDGSLAAHFEHTVAVTKNGAEVLTVI